MSCFRVLDDAQVSICIVGLCVVCVVCIVYCVVNEAKKDAYAVRRWNGGSPKKKRHLNLANGMKTAWFEISHGSQNTVCSETNVCRQEKQKKEEIEQQQRMAIMEIMMRETKGKKAEVGGSVNVGRLIVKKCGSTLKKSTRSKNIYQGGYARDLEKNSVALQALLIVEPKSSEYRREAAVRKGAEELTLRRGEAGGLRTFIDTTNVGDNRWRQLLLDEDWHAICQAIYKGTEGEEWGKLYFK